MTMPSLLARYIVMRSLMAQRAQKTRSIPDETEMARSLGFLAGQALRQWVRNAGEESGEMLATIAQKAELFDPQSLVEFIQTLSSGAERVDSSEETEFARNIGFLAGQALSQYARPTVDETEHRRTQHTQHDAVITAFDDLINKVAVLNYDGDLSKITKSHLKKRKPLASPEEGMLLVRDDRIREIALVVSSRHQDTDGTDEIKVYPTLLLTPLFSPLVKKLQQGHIRASILICNADINDLDKRAWTSRQTIEKGELATGGRLIDLLLDDSVKQLIVVRFPHSIP
jgi:hypothetical protein